MQNRKTRQMQGFISRKRTAQTPIDDQAIIGGDEAVVVQGDNHGHGTVLRRQRKVEGK